MEFARLLTHKFDVFKALLFELLEETGVPALRFNQEEIRRIADYTKASFFKHLRLYDFVLNNKQLNEVKRLTINVNEPIVAASLSDALLIGSEEAFGYEDDAEAIRSEVVARKDAVKAEQRHKEEVEARLA